MKVTHGLGPASRHLWGQRGLLNSTMHSDSSADSGSVETDRSPRACGTRLRCRESASGGAPWVHSTREQRPLVMRL